MKQIKRIKKSIVDFVKSIDEELSVTFINGVGYYYETATNTINVDFTDETEEFGFLRHLKEVHNCDFAYDYSITLWSILHEIGHYETENEIEEDTDDEELRFWLSMTDKKVAENPTIQDRYFNLPSEWVATEWAIDWIKDNLETAKKFRV